MATIAIMVASAFISAAAFTAGNALYDKFGRGDGSAERIRHDVASEELQKATSDWNRKRLETLDWINNKINEKRESRETFDDVEKALDFYNETHPDALLELPKMPLLEDFYKPSIEQKYYEIAIVSVLSGVIGYSIHKII